MVGNGRKSGGVQGADEMTIELGWWCLPLGITVIGSIWAIFIVKDDGGMMGGLSNLLAMGIVSFISMFAWMLWGIFK